MCNSTWIQDVQCTNNLKGLYYLFSIEFNYNIFTTTDILHTYFGIGGLSLMDMYNLQPLSPTLNISERALNHLKSLQNSPETVSWETLIHSCALSIQSFPLKIQREFQKEIASKIHNQRNQCTQQ